MQIRLPFLRCPIVLEDIVQAKQPQPNLDSVFISRVGVGELSVPGGRKSNSCSFTYSLPFTSGVLNDCGEKSNAPGNATRSEQCGYGSVEKSCCSLSTKI